VAPPTPPTIRTLVPRLETCLAAGTTPEIVLAVQQLLSAAIDREGFSFPSAVGRTLPDRYARRLLYADRARRFVVVAMAWGPGQHTALHDHAGTWCIEAIVAGRMRVRRFELVSASADIELRFEERETAIVARGSTGALIPPFEYHVFGNDDTEANAITLHVYGGPLTRCSTFEAQANGTWFRHEKVLTYDPW
jgi:predicted metal-dependent enzyme (double-stranded beta helix superfamily)